MSKIAAVERSPEKAGVGGSIPSLATILSTTYTPPLRVRTGNFRTSNGPGIGPQRFNAEAGGCLLSSALATGCKQCCGSI